MVKSILLAGVGGQGTILTTKILTVGLSQKGYDVKMSEIHGMSQRGGSVTTQIKYGDKVYSPSIGYGEADLIVAFEKIEAARNLHYLKKGGAIVMDSREILPMPVLTGKVEYPHGVIADLSKEVPSLQVVEATKAAEEIGNIRCQNIVLLGALVKKIGLADDIDWIPIVETNVPAKAKEINVKAFRQGLGMVV